MIIALAGRRIDTPNATKPRFPLQNAKVVRERIHEFFVSHKVVGLICSAACGADLIALDVAGELGIQRRVILPFEQSRFRSTSVIDRPGEWGALFDRIVKEVQATGNLMILSHEDEDETVFAITNRVLVDEALTLARRNHKGEQLANSVLAVLVWDGQPRDEGDLTVNFADEALVRGVPVFEIVTAK